MKNPMVSIIIPMFNAADTIDSCITHLMDLRYPKERLEIIVVNNGSTDDSASITEDYPVKVISKIGGTIASVRNYGASFAKGEVYGFIDSDCAVFKDWLVSALRQLEKPEVAATGAGYVAPENYSWVEKAWLYESEHKPFETDFIPSGNFIVKADVFNSIGGFNDELTTCEDAEIGLRINKYGYKIINSSEIKSIHLRNPKTLKAFSKKEFWYGENMLDTLKFNYLDKVFVLSVFYLAAHVGILLGLSDMILTKDMTLFLGSTAFLLFLLIGTTLYRIMRSKKYELFFHTLILYYVYYASRGMAMINYFKKNLLTFMKDS